VTGGKTIEPPTPGEIFAHLRETELESFLVSLGPETALITDWEFESFFDERQIHPKSALGCVRLRWGLIRTNPSAAIAGFQSLVICSRRHENAIFSSVSNAAPGVPTYRLIADIATCVSAKTEVLPASEVQRISFPDELAKINRLDLVLCLPRSGSTWLCELIESAGITARCQEDLRPHVVFLATRFSETSFTITKWLALIFRRLTSDGITSSKVIATFLFDVIDAMNDEESEALQEAMTSIPEVRVLYLKRRNRALQAVSAYISNTTGIWHRRGPNRRQSRTRDVPYDFDKIKDIYRRLELSEARIDTWAQQDQTAKLIELTYEEIERAPLLALKAIAAELGISNTTPPASELRITRSLLNSEMAERFEVDLKEHAPEASLPLR
jgi:LPS sulfotransferase NodH